MDWSSQSSPRPWLWHRFHGRWRDSWGSKDAILLLELAQLDDRRWKEKGWAKLEIDPRINPSQRVGVSFRPTFETEPDRRACRLLHRQAVFQQPWRPKRAVLKAGGDKSVHDSQSTRADAKLWTARVKIVTSSRWKARQLWWAGQDPPRVANKDWDRSRSAWYSEEETKPICFDGQRIWRWH